METAELVPDEKKLLFNHDHLLNEFKKTGLIC